MFPSGDEFEFVPPPEAPVFEPDEEEWKDPLSFIAKIYPYAVKVGICKIRPPPDWQPPFSVDVEKFRFTPRIQKLNELEAKTRVKLNFIDAIAKFWELQGSVVKLPNVEKKPLDLHALHKIVQAEGGYEDVTRLRRWSRIALLMGYNNAPASAVLRRHYEKILYPYDVFMSGAMTGDSEASAGVIKQEIDEPKLDVREIEEDNDEEEDMEDMEYKPPSGGNYGTRRSKYKTDNADSEIDYNKNPELRKLQFLAPGPKISGKTGRVKKQSGKYNKDDYISLPSDTVNIQGLTRRKAAQVKKTKESNIFDVVASFVDDYRCNICDNGDDEHSMLLCDSCDSSYHTFCLIPPLTAIPPGDWRCPKCLAKECKKPTEAFGFEQAKKRYSLQEFGHMADKFKEEYFSMPTHEVPLHVVEKEFWRLVSSLEDDVFVEYGADLHSADHGSGFPMRENTDDPDDEEYIRSPWNLNNLPNNDKSVLKYITQNISGMKVPWVYIGMCFSSFCWHTEDHWSYSINYMHWGEPKTWYGVPQSEAEKLEECVKNIAPELFEKHPDLFHHLVTTCSPTTLMNYGVPVVRTNQCAGEFVVTFPRAYHAGFNQGYNCAEAVNFCPADWLPTGQKCVDHYANLKRSLVFSHQELVCKMTAAPDTLDLDLAKKLYENMKVLVDQEVSTRRALHEKGIKDRQREAFELIPDDARQCYFCKTTMFFSAVVCSCNKKLMSCLKHYDELCVCQNFKKYVRYRYTLEELPQMLENLKKRADSFDNWEKKVEEAFSCSPDARLELVDFKELITEAEESQFPDCELLDQLRSCVGEAEQCVQVASQLLAKKHKTRKTSTSATSTAPKLSLDELKEFSSQVQNLPCVIKEARAVDSLMAQVESFRFDAKILLNSNEYNEKKVSELLEHTETMDVDLPEINDLQLDLKAAKWLKRIEEILNQDEPISLDVIRSCVDQGIGLRKKQASEKPLSRLKELLYAADRWEEKAKLCLQAKPRHMIGTLEVIVQEASKVKIVLPNVTALSEALKKAKEWSTKVDKIQNDDYYPYYDILEALVIKGRPIPVRLEQLPQMESQVAAARAWKDRTGRTFVKKGSNKQLIEILRPRKDIGKFDRKCKKKKVVDKKDGVVEKEKAATEKQDVKSKNKKDKKIKDRTNKENKETKDNIIEVEQKPSETTDPIKPIGLPVDAINVQDYTAPNPVTVAEGLKKDEEFELQSMRDLRSKNKEKILAENIEGPYCLCRKPIDGFMIRCNLCYEWYHSSCIVVPKTVHGKPIGKGCSAWAAAREVRYLCTLCCRSRRPRLDTILSLLMSLQKLPVRVPEGEALQFLTERSMNWQDRAKQALSNSEIQRILTDVKADLEKVTSEKQTPGTTITQTALIQKLLGVRKAEKQSSLEQDVKKELKSEDILPTVVESMKMEIDDAKSERTAKSEAKKSDAVKDDNDKSDSTSKKSKDVDADLECTEKMGGSPVAVKEVTATEEEVAVNPQIVHLQSASSSRAQSPIDVCTPMESLKPTKEQDSKTMEPLPDALLDQLEMLMFEGDILEVGLDEVLQIWAILQIQRPFLKDDCMIMNAEYRRKIIKDRKRQKKRKHEEISKPTSLPTSAVKPASASPAILNILKEKQLSKKLKEESTTVVKKENTSATPVIVDDDDVDEDDCSARPCHKPLGEEVEWVQCDTCENWYHVVCVGISAQEASCADEYVCPYCKPKNNIKEEPTDAKSESDIPNNIKTDSPSIPNLDVIAEVAHQLITDAESNKIELDQKEVCAQSTQHLDLDSLICLADVSQKMDVASVPEKIDVASVPTNTSGKETSITIADNTDQTADVSMEIEPINTTNPNSLSSESVLEAGKEVVPTLLNTVNS